jgi:hypothetical protein
VNHRGCFCDLRFTAGLCRLRYRWFLRVLRALFKGDYELLGADNCGTRHSCMALFDEHIVGALDQTPFNVLGESEDRHFPGQFINAMPFAGTIPRSGRMFLRIAAWSHRLRPCSNSSAHRRDTPPHKGRKHGRGTPNPTA